jgi:hypothetical protein
VDLVLDDEELSDLCESPYVVTTDKRRRMCWVGIVAGMGETRNVYRNMMGKLHGK